MPKLGSMERRVSARYQGQQRALIGSASDSACLISDVRETDAHLSGKASPSVPDRFEPCPLGRSIPVWMMWRGAESVGMAFVGEVPWRYSGTGAAG